MTHLALPPPVSRTTYSRLDRNPGVPVLPSSPPFVRIPVMLPEHPTMIPRKCFSLRRIRIAVCPLSRPVPMFSSIKIMSTSRSLSSSKASSAEEASETFQFQSLTKCRRANRQLLSSSTMSAAMPCGGESSSFMSEIVGASQLTQGRITVKVEPLPTSEVTRIVPPA